MNLIDRQLLIRSTLGLSALVIGTSAAISVMAASAPRSVADDPPSVVGTYSRQFTGAGGQVTETLEIKADKTVTWTSNYPGRPPLVQTGIWNARGATLIVMLDKRNGEKMPADERVVFDRKGRNLKGRTFDKNVHGNSAMVFHPSEK